MNHRVFNGKPAISPVQLGQCLRPPGLGLNLERSQLCNVETLRHPRVLSQSLDLLIKDESDSVRGSEGKE